MPMPSNPSTHTPPEADGATPAAQGTFVRPAALAGRHFSTVIVGAGINGAGVFRDLSLQGVDCLVVDKGDIAAGASSAPSRMIHGGLRYLEHGSFALVAEATRERNLLLRNAPHLVRPLQTVVPLTTRTGGLLSGPLRFLNLGAAHAPARGLWVVSIGLWLYDLLGRRERMLPTRHIERVAETDRRLFRDGVRWTATYFDASISHPEWLILELLEDARRDQPASFASNHCAVLGCRGQTVTLQDQLSGEIVEVTADTVVNATGAWLDHTAERLQGEAGRVMGTKGSHLVLEHPALHRELAGRMAFFEAADGRVCIVYPFFDKVLVGSTDIRIDDPDLAVTEAAEVDYLLDVLQEVFPRQRFGRHQVRYTYVGVRPLARSTADKTGRIARDHSVAVEPPNRERGVPMVCLVGGKWTTFRALAELASDEVLHLLARQRRRSTERLPIGGGAGLPKEPRLLEGYAAQLAAEADITVARALALVNRYGSRAAEWARAFGARGDRPLRHAPGYSVREVQHLCRHTGVMRLDDLVIRRTVLAISGQMNDALLTELAGLAAEALGWSEQRRAHERDQCARLLRERHGVILDAAAVGPSAAATGRPAPRERPLGSSSGVPSISTVQP